MLNERLINYKTTRFSNYAVLKLLNNYSQYSP